MGFVWVVDVGDMEVVIQMRLDVGDVNYFFLFYQNCMIICIFFIVVFVFYKQGCYWFVDVVFSEVRYDVIISVIE